MAAADPDGEPSDYPSLSIADLHFSVRASNCFRRHGIRMVAELVRLSEAELLSWPNLGRRTLAEISATLGEFGLRLRMGEDAELRLSVQPPGSAQSMDSEEPPTSENRRAEHLALAFLKACSARDYAVIRERVIACISTLEVLGGRFGVTRERIRQIEKKARRRVDGFLVTPSGCLVRKLSDKVRLDLGSAVPATNLPAYFAGLCSSINNDDDRDLIAEFLLLLAGPYWFLDSWRISDNELATTTTNELLAARDSRGWLSPAAAEACLLKASIHAPQHVSWLRSLGFIEMDGGWLLRMSSIPDRAEQVLRYRGVPVTAQELLPMVDCESVRSLRTRLLEDERFKRITKQGHFALREWAQFDEYSGIAEEIAEEIIRQGGQADAQILVQAISQRYGVKAHSVYQYLSAPMFIKVGQGQVRLRKADEMLAARSDPRFCQALYRIDGLWTLRVKINSETLRGSGRPLQASVSVLVGCQPGERRVFKSPRDEVVVSWPAGSASGPNIGSLKPDVDALGGVAGDYIFLAFGEDVIGVRLLKALELEAVSKEAQLVLLVGLPHSTPADQRLSAIASAIGLRMETPTTCEDIHACLMRRNEGLLAALIDMPNLEDPQAIFAHLESTLWA